jgi:AraC-like DNA-binding protein
VTATDDVEEATAALSDAYTALTMRAGTDGDGFRMRLKVVRLPEVDLATLDLSRSTIRTEPYRRYTVCLPVQGTARASTADGSAAIAGRCGIVVSPVSGRVHVDYHGERCRVATVSFDRAALEAELALLLGQQAHEAVRFDLGLDLAACSTFDRVLELLRAEVANPAGSTAHAPLAVRVGRLVMAGLLLGQRHQYTEELHRPAGFEGPRAIRRAVATVEEQPMAIVTVADIAAAANLSVRALEDGFRRHVGTSPMAYLRQVRLARAYDELLAAAPDATTATAVAQRWGFAHYGRFAALYRQRYGCSPSATLRSSSGPAG